MNENDNDNNNNNNNNNNEKEDECLVLSFVYGHSLNIRKPIGGREHGNV